LVEHKTHQDKRVHFIVREKPFHVFCGNREGRKRERLANKLKKRARRQEVAIMEFNFVTGSIVTSAEIVKTRRVRIQWGGRGPTLRRKIPMKEATKTI